MSILKPGRNCWRIKHADRVAFLIDGESYFTALHDVLLKAEEDITILSWDIYSGLKLGALQGDHRTLSKLLDETLRSKDKLQAYILNWDFSVLFSMSREWLPSYKLGWLTHPRLNFELDNQHPIGASHHQKVVVLDNRMAFVGGLDLTRGRWDTNEHITSDVRRKQVDGTVGRPYHDVQVAVSGEVASALHDLTRERWRRATEQGPAAASLTSKSDAGTASTAIWPTNLKADLRDVNVAISRTEPSYADYKNVQEVEQLYLDAIASAQDYIYIENQYFTCAKINLALAERLQDKNGPEIVINLPLETEGWLAQSSMDIIRVKLLKELREADRFNRLGVYYPFKRDAQTAPINLHAKVMLVDDCFVRVGSSNLNNRSMGLDTECDLAIELAKSSADNNNLNGIIGFRNRLLAEHLDVSCEKVDEEIKQKHSVLNAIEVLRDEDFPRTLLPLEDKLPDFADGMLTKSDFVDPEKPVNIDSIFYHAIPDDHPPKAAKRVIAWLVSLVALLALALAWNYTPMGDWLDIETVTTTIAQIKHNPLAPALLVPIFVIAALLMTPVTILIISTVVVFGPFLGFGYALLGGVASAIVGYAIGSSLGGDAIRGLAGGKIKRISQKLAKRGTFTVVILRIVPVAPFTIINLVAGASHIQLRDFFWGTLIGLTPGIFAIALLTDRVQATLRDPQPGTILVLAAIAVLIVTAGYCLSRYLVTLGETKS